MSSTADPRAVYRRRLKHRQTTIIGGTLAIMAALVILCLMVWSGMLPVPDPGFSTTEESSVTLKDVCPPEGAVTADLTTIPLNVYNGTNTTGLAGSVAGTLTDAALTVSGTADWPQGAYSGEIILTTSPAGLANAYSIRQIFAGNVTVQIDENQAADDPTVGIVLGEEYNSALLTTEEIQQIPPDQPITPPEGCVPAPTSPPAEG